VIRATYQDLQPQLARIAGVSGMAVSDARVLSYANLAIQELMDVEDWPQTVVRMRFKVNNARINVPSEFDRILMLMVNGVPQPMQSPWFEFVGYGWGWLAGEYNVPPTYGEPGPLGFTEGVLDKEQVATFEDIPNDGTIYYPTVYGTADERVNGVRPNITLQGYDNNGQWVRSDDPSQGWIDGVNVPINGDTAPFASVSSQAFSVVTGILKPVTNGAVSLYVSSATTGAQNVFLCEYAPYDTRPYYRRYCIPNLNQNPATQPPQTYCVDARMRKRFTPIVSQYDFLILSNLPALSTMFQAINYRESGDIQNYAAFKAVAVSILKDEMKSYIGKQRQKPLITVNEGFGVRLDGNYIL
jgi:hypothetical protein